MKASVSPVRRFVRFVAVLGSVLAVRSAAAELLFEEDFEGGTIDESKWRLDPRPFETGDGNFRAEVEEGRLKIVGQGTANWWGGLALATLPTFKASPDEPLTFAVERVSHERQDNIATGAAEDSSTRTSVWITDAQRQSYVLFSQNSNEGGWTYNKRVGDPDDNPTNAGIDIFEFDMFDADFGPHEIELVADGEFVQIFLNGVAGPLVRFPLTEGIVFELGAYARRGEGPVPTDTVAGQFDDVTIQGAGETCVSLTPQFTQVEAEGDPPPDPEPLTLEIPQSAERPAAVTITSTDPGVAFPAGASADGSLEVVFEEGDPAFVAVPIEVGGPGRAEFRLSAGFETCTGDPAKVYVPAVRLADDFEGGIDGEVWEEQDEPFEDGAGIFEAVAEGGTVRISGQADAAFWPGLALFTTRTFAPAPDTPVTFRVDQTLSSFSVGLYRAGIWVSGVDREDFVFFSFVGGGAVDWAANSTTSNLWPATGEGTDLAAYNCCGFEVLDAARRVEIVVDGESAAVVMDGVQGGSVPFELEEVVFGFGAYASAAGDSVEAVFDNAVVLGPPPSGDDGDDDARFIRGDTDASGSINITDGIRILNFLFIAGGEELLCEDAADVDNSNTLNITDGISVLNFLFIEGGVPPVAPHPECGTDPDRDEAIDCAASQPGCL